MEGGRVERRGAPLPHSPQYTWIGAPPEKLTQYTPSADDGTQERIALQDEDASSYEEPVAHVRGDVSTKPEPAPPAARVVREMAWKTWRLHTKEEGACGGGNTREPDPVTRPLVEVVLIPTHASLTPMRAVDSICTTLCTPAVTPKANLRGRGTWEVGWQRKCANGGRGRESTAGGILATNKLTQ
jgi:hypothetical protein